MTTWPILSVVTFLPVVGALLIYIIRGDHGKERHDRENGPGGHHWPPKPKMNQVINPAAPISMAKA